MKYSELFKKAVTELSAAGNEAPEYEARELMYHFLGTDRMFLIDRAEDNVPEEKEILFMDAVEKRKTGFPLQYILGSWSFMETELSVGEGVLIPRDDTEVCVRECITMIENAGIKSPVIIDLCSGSGAIAISVAKKLPGANVTALEFSEKAFGYLCRNIELNKLGNVSPVNGDIYEYFKNYADGYFDVIISNPPYIRTDEIPTLQKEVLFEPEMALDGGSDGLDFYRCIADKWLSKLKKGGIMSLEIGEDQGESVPDIFRSKGCGNITVVKDIQNLDRAVTLYLN